MITLVLDDSAEARAVIASLLMRGELFEDVARGHSELACRRIRTSTGDELAYLEDHVAEVRFITIDGPQATAHADQLMRAFRFVARGTLLASMNDNAPPGAWIRGLSRLAVLRPAVADAALLAIWTRALAHPVAAVRRAAIRTCYGCRWPALGAIVRARIDADPRLREPLRQLAAHLARITS